MNSVGWFVSSEMLGLPDDDDTDDDDDNQPTSRSVKRVIKNNDRGTGVSHDEVVSKLEYRQTAVEDVLSELERIGEVYRVDGDRYRVTPRVSPSDYYHNV